MKACAVICRKATVALPDANYLSSRCQSQSPRAQNRGFCAFLPFETPIFGTFEHKIGIFVRFCPPEPQFSGISSTKSGFLCFFGLQNPHFRVFRAQNPGFCALFAFETPIFGHFEHKIEVFVLFCPPEPLFSGISSTKSAFLCALVGPRPGQWLGATGATGATGAMGAMGAMEQQERRLGQFGLLTFCHKGALFELWHSI